MRIAFVICGQIDHVSGGFHYDRMVITQLHAQGHQVDVVELPWRRSGGRGYLRAWADNLTPWPLRARQYDVVVQDQLCHAGVFWRNRWLRRAGVPIVALVHNLTSCQPAVPLRPLVHRCERRYFRGIDAVIAVCASSADDVRRCAGQELPTHVAHAGRDDSAGATPVVDADAIITRARAPGPLRLLFVGQVARHKGLHRLLPVLAGLTDVDLTLDVAGSLAADPAYVAEIRAQAAVFGLVDRLRLHDQLGRAALADLRARSHLLVMPSDREAYPLAALEALGAGLPVLLTDAGGTAELLGAGAAGRLLAPDDVGGWVQAIAGLARDRAALAAAGRAALERHRAHGTWAQTAAGISDFLLQVQARRRKTA